MKGSGSGTFCNGFIPGLTCIGVHFVLGASEAVEKHVAPINVVGALSETPGRKRPLLSGESAKVPMTPSKRTVMAILARARTAQVHAKDNMVAFSPHFNG